MNSSANSIQPKITARPINAEDYRPYGSLLSIESSRTPYVLTNLGTARRYNQLCDFENLRSSAILNVCHFECSPWARENLEIGLLEKHPHSTQIFHPMSRDGTFLAVVALGEARPRMETLEAFLVNGPAGISYKPGVWHHPMIVLDGPLTFSCLVAEDGSPRDCEVFQLEERVRISIPGL